MQTSVDDVQSQPPADLRELLRESTERSEEEGRGGEGEAAREVNGSTSSPNENTGNGNSAETPAVEGLSQSTTPGVTDNTQPPLSSKSNAAPPAAVRRYNSATITKTFMMKATSSSNSGSVSGSQSSKNANAGSFTTSRSAQANPSAHPSRLVTSKLASTGMSAAASTAGWTTSSKPGSSTASVAASPVGTPGIGQGKTLSVSNGADKTKTIGRNASPGKPWGNVTKEASAPVFDTAKDFPTAAEVVDQAKAQNHTSKTLQAKLDAEIAASQEQDDGFRGLHLNPKNKHWDEDTGDDSDFLGGVVEFADGTAYSVPPSASVEVPPPDFGTASNKHSVQENVSGLPSISSSRGPNGPIRKEDRLPDDYDRSWPRGPHEHQRRPSQTRISPAIISRELVSPAQSNSTLPSERGDRDKVLFNERSNRLEPYSSQLTTKPPTGSWGRRESHGSASGRPNNVTTPQFLSRDLPPQHNHRGRDFLDRDVPPSSAVSPNMSNRPLDDRPGRGGWGVERGRPEHGRRNKMVPPPPPVGSDGAAWGKNSHRKWPGTGTGRDEPPPPSPHNPRPGPGRWNSADHDRDGGYNRQSHPGGRGRPSDVHLPTADPRAGMHQRRDSVVSSAPRSPAISTLAMSERNGTGETTDTSAIAEALSTSTITQVTSSPIPDPAVIGDTQMVPIMDLDGVHKVAMHSAAERAKARRQEEENVREAQRERARAKAKALEIEMEEAKEKERKALAEKEAELEREKQRLMDLEASKKAEAEAADKARKEEMERQAREKQAQETHAIKLQSEAKIDPLMAKSPSTARPRLQLLPRTIPIPAAEPLHEQRPELPTCIVLPGSMESEAIRLLRENNDSSLEVEFSDMGAINEFINSAVTTSKLSPVPRAQSRRPLARDFFEDQPAIPQVHSTAAPASPSHFVPPSPKDDLSAWRRAPPKISHATSSPDVTTSLNVPHHVTTPVSGPSIGASATSTVRGLATPPAQTTTGFMSSLEDTISRFKGVLQDMRGEPVHNSLNFPTLMPSLSVLSKDPAPTSSPPSPNSITAKLSKQPGRNAISEKELKLFLKRDPPHSWDILTWAPPIAGLSRKTLSREELYVAGKSRLIKVRLPKATPKPTIATRTAKVRLPPSAPVAHGISSQSSQKSSRGAGMEEGSWRKQNNVQAPLSTIPEVDPVSRSPPPIPVVNEVPKAAIQIPPSPSDVASKEELASPPTSLRGKGKLRLGTDVAFYLPVEAQVPDPSLASHVRFTVTSEVDENNNEGPSNSFTESNSDGKTTDETPSSQSASALLTPPSLHAATAWSNPTSGYSVPSVTAEVGSERIKAMWDRTAHDGPNTENSLKGIADEFPTTIPLSIQDMKSDDGDGKRDNQGGSTSSPSPSTQTDPPVPRRSLLDIHRAFQVVPATNKSATNFLTPESHPQPRPSPVPPPQIAVSQPYVQTQPQQQQQQPQPQPTAYTMQQFGQTQVPGLMWGSSAQYPLNGANSHRLQAPAPPVPGPSPPLAQSQQGPWPQQVQYALSPQQFAYMHQRPVAHSIGPNSMNSHVVHPNPAHSPHIPQAPMYPPQRQMSNQGPPQAYSPRPSPNMYSIGAVGAPQGYGMPMGSSGPPGRGGMQQARSGYELPPPVANAPMYQQPGRYAGWPSS
ncbi:hypothetical protein FRB95_004494 [Tulasnella sp. JGI-2019a]|nr:hypothetical protein FRB95_004494 [Tulasnella sp. JGI-2019a]